MLIATIQRERANLFLQLLLSLVMLLTVHARAHPRSVLRGLDTCRANTFKVVTPIPATTQAPLIGIPSAIAA
jgi:hypothetical protein